MKPTARNLLCIGMAGVSLAVAGAGAMPRGVEFAARSKNSQIALERAGICDVYTGPLENGYLYPNSKGKKVCNNNGETLHIYPDGSSGWKVVGDSVAMNKVLSARGFKL
jgi:hypothetical protein